MIHNLPWKIIQQKNIQVGCNGCNKFKRYKEIFTRIKGDNEMKAIILAAGLGNRLQEILEGKPKPLLKVKNKSIIQYSLDALSKTSLKKIHIVIGHKGEFIKNEIGSRYKNLEISYCNNDLYSSTGSMHSLFCGLNEPEDCLVLDGDIIYEDNILEEIISNKQKNLVLLTKCGSRGDEVFVTLENEKVIYLSKKNYFL